jgi:TetR/AcrR family transcriptional regulator, transcriptional repressor for nem operon
MRYSPEHKETARAKILSAVGRGFRRRGYDGIGVDGLAKEAGVTSGAFYGYFSSKGEAFEAAALMGLVDLRQAIERFQAEDGGGWLGRFVDFYLSTKRTCELGESCALQSLTPEVARAGRATRSSYEVELLRVVEAAAAGLPGKTPVARRKLAWTILAALSGGVTLARAAEDPKVGLQIAGALKTTIDALVAAVE